jgi:exopolysaccharide production protein ExoZ
MIKTLQAGRALAAISVAAFHLSLNMGAARYGGVPVFRELTQYGKHGVDFFFVLSGFIILFAHARDIGHPGAWGGYLYKRFVRVYPIYWLYTLVFVLALLTLGGTDATMPANGPDWLTSLSLIRFTPASPPLGQGWTLFHEVAFYVVFSVLILNRKLGLAALAAFMAVALVFYPAEPGELPRTAFNVYTSDYNLYFLCGMGAYWLYKKAGNGLAQAVVGAAIAVAALAFEALPVFVSRIMLASGLALMLAGLATLERTGRLSIHGGLAFAGDASYSIYLTHINVEGLLLKVAVKLHLNAVLGPQIVFFLVLAATVGLGCVAYLLVERPLMRLLRRRKSGEQKTVIPAEAGIHGQGALPRTLHRTRRPPG